MVITLKGREQMSITNFSGLIFLIIMVVIFFVMLKLAELLKINEIRKIPALDSIDEVIRACAEKGQDLHYTPAWLFFRAPVFASYIPASMEILKKVSKTCGELNVPLWTTCADPQIYLMVTDFSRQGFVEAGKPEAYDEEKMLLFSMSLFV